jgi:holo-[acyl-carrier protein] synthase
MEVVHGPSGAPKIRLTGAAERFLKENQITEIQISLTHARDYAAANAIAIVGAEG